MSKSLGNVLSPQEVLSATGGCTDVLRRWAAASGLGMRSTVSISAFNAHTVAYKKVRLIPLLAIVLTFAAGCIGCFTANGLPLSLSFTLPHTINGGIKFV